LIKFLISGAEKNEKSEWIKEIEYKTNKEEEEEEEAEKKPNLIIFSCFAKFWLLFQWLISCCWSLFIN
jgi:hypothetical protein